LAWAEELAARIVRCPEKRMLEVAPEAAFRNQPRA
jgi:hypothetical protein